MTRAIEPGNSAATILTLDRHLARYGPETKPTRDLIRRAVEFRLRTTWDTAGGDTQGLAVSEGTPAVEEVENQILSLSPQTEAQRWFKSEAAKRSSKRDGGSSEAAAACRSRFWSW